MRRALSSLLALILSLGLTACGGTAPVEAAGSALDLADAILQSQSDVPPLEPLTLDSEAFAPYASSLYNIDPDTLEDGAIYYAEGVEASEIAVLVFASQEDAQAAEAALSDYLISRADSFTGYVPEQAALVRNSKVAAQGRYAALLICPDPEAAEVAFSACLTADWAPPSEDTATADSQAATNTPPRPSRAPQEQDTPEPSKVPVEESGKDAELADSTEPPADETPQVAPSPEPPAEDRPAPPVPAQSPEAESAPSVSGEYDREAVLSAWRDGDPTGLEEKNRMVFDAASAVLTQVITQDMTDYQRELAIHDYITGHGRYDPEANSNAPDAAPDPDNDNPYGMLVNGVGICRGYASTFQLLMDMLGIECITVEGHSGRGEHAWNMVRLDEEWYGVDVTWDDPSGGQPGHRYFNVTSQFLQQTDHQWDPSGIPEATATLWAYQG